MKKYWRLWKHGVVTAVLLHSILARPDSTRINGKVIIADGREGDLASMVVYWQGAEKFPALPKSTSKVHVMQQKEKKFAPHVRAIRSGEAIDFRNEDDLFHNVFSLDPEHKFDLGVYKKNKRYDDSMKKELSGQFDSKVTFKRPGKINVFCHLHEEMSGIIYSFNHGYFAQATDKGEFTIAMPPKGNQVLVVEGPQFSRPTLLSVTIPSAAPLVIEVTPDRSMKAPEHKNKKGEAYQKKEWSLDDEDVY